MLIFLFGLPGVGKNYVGEILANHYGYYFWDADLALPVKMREAIKKKQVFTQEMRDQLIQIIIEKTKKILQHHTNVVITQALFKEKNRIELAKAFPEATFCLIQASPERIISRLQQRNNTVDQAYAKKIQHEFEQPLLPHKIIINENDQSDLLHQLITLQNLT